METCLSIITEPVEIGQDGTITVDLRTPRTIRVQGVNEITGIKKDYLLKVTQSGKLLLI